MTAKEAVNWIVNISADIGKREHKDLWHYEQALYEIRDMLQSEELAQSLPNACADVPDINDEDMISRKAAIDALSKHEEKPKVLESDYDFGRRSMLDACLNDIEDLPSVQPEQADCEYCYEDSDGFVRVLEKNGHAVIHGDTLHLKAKGWRGDVKIDYCPMCGRRLKHE